MTLSKWQKPDLNRLNLKNVLKENIFKKLDVGFMPFVHKMGHYLSVGGPFSYKDQELTSYRFINSSDFHH